MEEQLSSPSPKSSHGLVKNIVRFLILILLVIGVYLLWSEVLSPEAKRAREAERNYQKYEEWKKEYDQKVSEDVYGGKTPEETLQLFISALEKEDIELASKYFVIDARGTQEAYKQELLKKSTDEIENIISIVKNSEEITDIPNLEGMRMWGVVNKEGLLDYSITLKLNTSTAVWKIEEM